MSFQSKLLIARPMLQDPVFGGKVVLIAKYDEKVGAEGFILNGPVVGRVGFGEVKGPHKDEATDKEEIRKIIESGAIESAPLYSGGPCVSPGLFMIHGHEDLATFVEDKGEFEIGNTLSEPPSAADNTIMPGVYYGSPATMAKIVMDGKVEQQKFRFFNGVSGWSAGQLEREIEAGAWTVVDATPEVIFNIEEANKLVKPKEESKDEPPPFRYPNPSWN